jgi:hypothetical protein
MRWEEGEYIKRRIEQLQERLRKSLESDELLDLGDLLSSVMMWSVVTLMEIETFPANDTPVDPWYVCMN